MSARLLLLALIVTCSQVCYAGSASGGWLEFLDLSWIKANSHGHASSTPSPAPQESKDSTVEMLDLNAKTPSLRATPTATAKQAPLDTLKLELQRPVSGSTVSSSKSGGKAPVAPAATAAKQPEFLDLTAKKAAVKETKATPPAASSAATPATTAAKHPEFLDLTAKKAAVKETKATPSAVSSAATPATTAAKQPEFLDLTAKKAAVKETKATPSAVSSAATPAATAAKQPEFLDLTAKKAAVKETKATPPAVSSAATPAATAAKQPEFLDLTAKKAAVKETKATPSAVSSAATPAATAAKQPEFLDLTAKKAAVKETKATPSAVSSAATPAATAAKQPEFLDLAANKAAGRRLEDMEFLDLGLIQGASPKAAGAGSHAAPKPAAQENSLAVPSSTAVAGDTAMPVATTNAIAASKTAPEAVKEDAAVQFLDLGTPQEAKPHHGSSASHDATATTDAATTTDATTASLVSPAAAAAVTSASEAATALPSPQSGPTTTAASASTAADAKGQTAELGFLDVGDKSASATPAIAAESVQPGEEVSSTPPAVTSQTAPSAHEVRLPSLQAADLPLLSSWSLQAPDVKPVLLITDVACALGRQLAQTLVPVGKFSVIGLHDPEASLEALSGLLSDLTLVPMTVSEDRRLSDWVAQTRPHVIFHVAERSPAWDASLAQHVATSFSVNVQGTTNVLEAVRRADLASITRIFVAGSSTEYGRSTASYASQTIPETALLEPLHPYGLSKMTAEKIALQYAEMYGLQVVVGRLFPFLTQSANSAHQVSSSEVAWYCQQIAAVEANVASDVRVRHTNLNVVKDIVDVRDVAVAVIKLTFQGRMGQVYNVGRGQGVRMEDVLKKLVSLSTVAEKIQLQEMAVGGAEKQAEAVGVDLGVAVKLRGGYASLVADMSKAQADIQWKPSLPMVQTLQDELDFWREWTRRMYSKPVVTA